MNMRLALAITLTALLMTSACASISQSLERALLFHPRKGLSASPVMAGLQAEDIFLQSGGFRIHGWFFPGYSESDWVVYLHGNGENLSDILVIIKAVAPLKLNILAVDYRGYGDSEGEPSVDGIVEDAVAAVDWVTQDRKAPPERVVLWGRSLGAAAALQAAAKRPGLGGVIVESGFVSLRRIAAHHAPWIPSFLVRDKLNSVEVIRWLAIPKLVIHGEKDEVIPFTHGQQLYRDACFPKEFLPLPAAGHNDILQAAGEAYLQGLGKWLNTK